MEERKRSFTDASCKTSNIDYNRFTIYISNGKYCNSAAVDDLLSKIKPFLKRYKAEIFNYKRYFSGKPYKPGAIVKEYESVLKQAEENANKLSIDLNNITDQNLSQLESEFDNVQNEEITLQQTEKKYENYINNSNASTQNKNQNINSQPSTKESELLNGEKSIKEQLAEEKRKKQSIEGNTQQSKGKSNNEEKSIKEQLEEEAQRKKDLIQNPTKNEDSQGGSNNNSSTSSTEGKWVFASIQCRYYGYYDYLYFSNVIDLNKLSINPLKWFYNELRKSAFVPKSDGTVVYMYGKMYCGCYGYDPPDCGLYNQACFFATREDAEKRRTEVLQEKKLTSRFKVVGEIQIGDN